MEGFREEATQGDGRTGPIHSRVAVWRMGPEPRVAARPLATCRRAARRPARCVLLHRRHIDRWQIPRSRTTNRLLLASGRELRRTAEGVRAQSAKLRDQSGHRRRRLRRLAPARDLIQDRVLQLGKGILHPRPRRHLRAVHLRSRGWARCGLGRKVMPRVYQKPGLEKRN